MRSPGVICLRDFRLALAGRPSVWEIERAREKEEKGEEDEERSGGRVRGTRGRRKEETGGGQKEMKEASGEEHFSLDRGEAATV